MILPQNGIGQVIGRQMLRSGTSVGANYREAYRARSTPEFNAKMGICLQELEETVYWLELLEESLTVPPEQINYVREENRELIAIFVNILKKKRQSLSEETSDYKF